MLQQPRTLALSLALLAAGGSALYATTDRLRAFTTESARRLGVRQHPVDVPAVTLETQAGEHIDFAALRGKWLVVDFIYTRCPSYCGALGNEFAQLQEQLARPIAQGKVDLVSISFDPARDAPPELASYLQRMRSNGEGWIAARPVEADGLAQLRSTFGVTVIADGMGGYTHNAAIHLVDPQGRLVEIVSLGQSAVVAQAVLASLAP